MCTTLLALKSKWLFLMVLSFVIMMIIVYFFNNPLLPFPSLARFGYSWHHIPEFFMFLFFGAWLGEWSLMDGVGKFRNYGFYLIILIIAYFLGYLLFPSIFVVIPFMIIPSIAGFFINKSIANGKKREKARDT
jgi:hypothetical protein